MHHITDQDGGTWSRVKLRFLVGLCTTQAALMLQRGIWQPLLEAVGEVVVGDFITRGLSKAHQGAGCLCCW